MQLINRAVRDGITLNILNTEKFKSSRFSVNFILPLITEEIPYFTILPKLMKHGCQRYPSMSAMARKLDLMYATDIGYSVYPIGDRMLFTVEAEFLEDRYIPDAENLAEEVFSLLHEIFAHPLLTDDGAAFPPSIVAQEKENLMHDIRAAINNKMRYAILRTRHIMSENEPHRYSMLPTEEDMEHFDDSRILPCLNKLLHASRVEYFYIGSESIDKVLSLTRHISSFLGDRTPIMRVSPTHVSAAGKRDITEHAVTAQAQLCMGFRIGILPDDALSFAYPTFAAILATSPVSKLFLNVREKHSLCYSCHMLSDTDNGIAIILAGIAKENKEAAIAAIEEQIADMKEGNISDEELLFARSSIRDTYRSVFDSPQSIERIYIRFIVREHLQTVDELIANAERTTREDLMHIAERMQCDTIYFLANTDEKSSADDNDVAEMEDEE